MSASPEPIAIRVHRLLAYAVISIEGTVDLDSREALLARLPEALALTDAALIINMDNASFRDTSGLHAFTRLVQEAHQAALPLLATGLRLPGHIVLPASAADGLLLQPDLQSALTWLETGRDGAPTTS